MDAYLACKACTKEQGESHTVLSFTNEAQVEDEDAPTTNEGGARTKDNMNVHTGKVLNAVMKAAMLASVRIVPFYADICVLLTLHCTYVANCASLICLRQALVDVIIFEMHRASYYGSLIDERSWSTLAISYDQGIDNCYNDSRRARTKGHGRQLLQIYSRARWRVPVLIIAVVGTSLCSKSNVSGLVLQIV